MRYLTPCLLLLAGVLAPAHSASIPQPDADGNVRTKVYADRSGKREASSEKYFQESTFSYHYDGRFGDHELPYLEKKTVLSNLVSTYLATFEDIGVETWLMHGSLLGWWWNKKILPWDTDVDVQVSEESMTFLANYYNMTVYHYKTPRIPEGRDYMLEINPHHSNRELSDKANVIDGRWVDTESGLFIDITAVRKNVDHPAGSDMLYCKDGHEFREKSIFPLRDTTFEGQAAKIPYAYADILTVEYGQQALRVTEYEDHSFDEAKNEWIPVLTKQADE